MSHISRPLLDPKLFNDFQCDLRHAENDLIKKSQINEEETINRWNQQLIREAERRKVSTHYRVCFKASFEDWRWDTKEYRIELLQGVKERHINNIRTFVQDLLKVSGVPVSLDRRAEIAYLLKDRVLFIGLSLEKKLSSSIVSLVLSYIGDDTGCFFKLNIPQTRDNDRDLFISFWNTPLLKEYLTNPSDEERFLLIAHIGSLNGGGDSVPQPAAMPVDETPDAAPTPKIAAPQIITHFDQEITFHTDSPAHADNESNFEKRSFPIVQEIDLSHPKQPKNAADAASQVDVLIPQPVVFYWDNLPDAEPAINFTVPTDADEAEKILI